MLKASNNHFDDISKIKIPKIRAFCNLKGANIAKKLGKIFSASFLEHKTYTNERGDQTHLLLIYFFVF